MPTPSTATAVDREAAWLSITNDSLPVLAASAGGPFNIIQAYRPRTPRTLGAQLYVLRAGIREDRFANQRRQAHYEFQLQIWWAVTSRSGNLEAEQRKLDAAVDLLLTRIGGLTGDKTHGGRFLAVAENPRWVEVAFTNPEETVPAGGGHSALEVRLNYTADDFEYTG